MVKLIGSISIKTSAVSPPYVGDASKLFGSVTLKTKARVEDFYSFRNRIKSLSLLFSKSESGRFIRIR